MPFVPGLPNPDGVPLSCGDCGAHFQLDPSGDIAGAACSECGGKRFFRSQPSATGSPGTLRDMVDSDSQMDEGGNPLGEGTIVGGDGEKPRGFRDDYMHSKVATEGYNAADWGESYCPNCHGPMHFQNGTWACSQCGQKFPDDWWHQTVEQEPQQFKHPDPWMDNEPGTMTFPQHWTGKVARQLEEGEPPIEGREIVGTRKLQRVERMNTLNMEPYPPLWDESYTKTAGPAALLPLVGEGLADAGGAAAAGGVAGDAAAEGGGLLNGIPGGNLLQKAIKPIMKGVFGQGNEQQQAGGMAPEAPAPAPDSLVTGSTDIPWLLMADYDTPHSVKSVDEQHDDPEHQDQQEFNDGDDSPSNLRNPNNEDSGADGEDGVRNATPGYGFGENSPGLERAMMVLPLLLHYFESDESGEADPLIKSLHEMLDKESPGYLDGPDDPDGHEAVKLIIQQHKPQHGHVQANVGVCGNCGGPLAADGSCPHCGRKTGIGGGQFGTQPMTGTGVSSPSGGSSYPPNKVGRTADNQVGPQTPEQKAAVIQLLEQQGRHHEVPMVELEPWRFAKELAEIQNQPNVAPLVQNPQTPAQTPPQGQMNPPGAMPVNDPTQMGGGAQPMQPMATVKGADANNAVPRCPKCHSATTSVHALGDNTTDGTSGYYARCHSCDHQWKVSTGRVIMSDVLNPAFEGQNTMTWQDNQGRPLTVGQTYELRSPNYPVPDEIKIISKKPDELGVKLVGDIAGITSDNTPDFTITPQQVQSSKYEFVPSNEADQIVDHSKGGMPGLEQIPQAPPTTDEASSSYPNRGTVSSYEDNEETCHRCGNEWITHTASSPTQTMHECARCGAAWETRDEFTSREANADLAWLMHDDSSDFFAEMERHTRASSGQGRDLHAIAASDDHYQAVKQVLDRNKMQREAGRHFTPHEQRELINERGKARNLNMLDIEDTHYATQYLPTTANEMNVPDSHLLLGI